MKNPIFIDSFAKAIADFHFNPYLRSVVSMIKAIDVTDLKIQQEVHSFDQINFSHHLDFLTSKFTDDANPMLSVSSPQESEGNDTQMALSSKGSMGALLELRSIIEEENQNQLIKSFISECLGLITVFPVVLAHNSVGSASIWVDSIDNLKHSLRHFGDSHWNLMFTDLSDYIISTVTLSQLDST